MSTRIDFDALDAQLLPRAEELIHAWLSNAKRVGSEMYVGNIRGDPGEPLKFNLTKGCWKDFATEDGGPGLISLYAAIHGIGPLKAARELLEHPQSAQRILVAAMLERIDAGWQLGEFGSRGGSFFCTRGTERCQVGIEAADPGQPIGYGAAHLAWSPQESGSDD